MNPFLILIVTVQAVFLIVTVQTVSKPERRQGRKICNF